MRDKMEMKEIMMDFVEKYGLKQMILIGTHGNIRSVEIDEVDE